MTEVFVLVYFAGVVKALAFVTIIGAVFGGIVLLISSLSTLHDHDRLPRHFHRWLAVWVVAVLTPVLLPSPTLLYSTAAVRAGVYAIETEFGDKAVKLLEMELDNALAAAQGKGGTMKCR